MRQTHNFSRQPESIGAARRFTSDALAGLDPELLSSVELMVSELATNCIRHTASEFELIVDQDHGQVRIDVRDDGGGEPVLLSPNPDDPDCGNVYRNLKFPQSVYEHIQEYQEEEVQAQEHASEAADSR
jgi:anti-sigma regulatory factor (Ser/Thr protein kinase)